MLTDYRSSTSKMDQPMNLFPPTSKKSSTFKPSVPKIVMDRIPRDSLEISDGLKQEERQTVFLENSSEKKMPLQMHQSVNTKESHLGNSFTNNPPLLLGSILGLFILYRVIHNYS